MTSFRRLLSSAAQAAATIALAASAATASAQTKWDLPAAYPASNFHTENLVQFANDIDKATGGKLKITVHANASLFKAPEIKRAVQGGQAQMGEVLLVNFQNEWQPFGIDGLPFLADSYDESMKLYKASKPALEKKLAEQGIMATSMPRTSRCRDRHPFPGQASVINRTTDRLRRRLPAAVSAPPVGSAPRAGPTSRRRARAPRRRSRRAAERAATGSS